MTLQPQYIVKIYIDAHKINPSDRKNIMLKGTGIILPRLPMVNLLFYWSLFGSPAVTAITLAIGYRPAQFIVQPSEWSDSVCPKVLKVV